MPARHPSIRSADVRTTDVCAAAASLATPDPCAVAAEKLRCLGLPVQQPLPVRVLHLLTCEDERRTRAEERPNPSWPPRLEVTAFRSSNFSFRCRTRPWHACTATAVGWPKRQGSAPSAHGSQAVGSRSAPLNTREHIPAHKRIDVEARLSTVPLRYRYPCRSRRVWRLARGASWHWRLGAPGISFRDRIGGGGGGPMNFRGTQITCLARPRHFVQSASRQPAAFRWP